MAGFGLGLTVGQGVASAAPTDADSSSQAAGTDNAGSAGPVSTQRKLVSRVASKHADAAGTAERSTRRAKKVPARPSNAAHESDARTDVDVPSSPERHPVSARPDGPAVPVAPSTGLVESLWLAVRHPRHTADDRQPHVDVTTSDPGPDSLPDLGDLLSRDGVDVTTDARGTASSIDGRFTDEVVTDAAGAAAVMNGVATALGAATGFANPAGISVSQAGSEHFYRFTETAGGIEVLGSDVIVVTDADGAVTGLFNHYRGVGDSFGVTPDASVDERAEIDRIAGRAYLGRAAGPFALRAVLSKSTFTQQLVVYSDGDGSASTLAWRVVMVLPDRRVLSPSGATYVIDADGVDAGSVLVTVSNAEPYSATDIAKDWLGAYRTITVNTEKRSRRTVSTLVDAGRNLTTYATKYRFLNKNSPILPGAVVTRGRSGWSPAAVSAHANAEVVYDYYRDVLGRTSFNGEGAPIEVSIRYREPYSRGSYANAFWDPYGQRFVIGDGGHLEASVDVLGHEYTHAVISYVVGDGGSVLDYGESGALNEALADIMGTFIEGKSGVGRWLLGEDSALGAVRDLADPTSITTDIGPYRDQYSQRYTGSSDDNGEHINSTIFSHAAYTMMTDPATAGISEDTWAQVYYHALFRLSPSSVFTDGRAAVLSSARALGFTSGQLAAVRRAFDGVGIGDTATSLAV